MKAYRIISLSLLLSFSVYVHAQTEKDCKLIMKAKNGIHTHIFSNGSVYEGEWLNNKIEGHGRMAYTNGYVYEGEWKNHKWNGYGTLKGKHSSYEGDWKGGLKEGFGKLYAKDGQHEEYYTGQFHNGKYHGQGRWRSITNGKTVLYSGKWIDNHRIGKGTYTTDGMVYEGIWESDEITGLGHVKLPIGIYEGSLHKAFFEGYGEMVYTNGDTYKGNWNRGEKHGKGTYYYADGSVYEGDWLRDEWHGQGRLTLADGSVQEGTFEQGSFVHIQAIVAK